MMETERHMIPEIVILNALLGTRSVVNEYERRPQARVVIVGTTGPNPPEVLPPLDLPTGCALSATAELQVPVRDLALGYRVFMKALEALPVNTEYDRIAEQAMARTAPPTTKRPLARKR